MTSPSPGEAWKALADECVHGALYDSPERQPFPRCLPGTRVHLLEKLHHAINHEERKIIWLSGESGSGKSAVAHTLAEEFRSNDALAATFFFSRRQSIRNTPARFWLTISYQLGLIHPRAKDLVIRAIANDPTLLKSERSRHDQFTQLVLAPLMFLRRYWDGTGKKMILLFDALDECEGSGYDHVDQLVDFFTEALQDGAPSFHVVMTSRPYFHIKNIMQHSSSVFSICMEDFDSKADIELFLRSSFDEIKCRHSLPVPYPSPSEADTLLLVDKVSHRFIVAATVVRLLKQKRSSELRPFVDALLQKQQMRSIDELYHDVIESSGHPSACPSLLALILSLRKSMSVNDIVSLINHDVRPTLDSMAAIVSVPPTDSSNPVTMYHTSLRDFLWDKTRSRHLYVAPSSAHCRLAHACLELMRRSLTKDVCRLGNPSLLHAEVDEFSARRDAVIAPALAYAVSHWLDHLCEATQDDRLYQLILTFVQEDLLCWIEMASVLDVLHTCTITLPRVIGRLQTWNSVSEGDLVVDLLYDAYRLVNEFFEPIRQSSLHVYHTALALSPTKIKLRQVYSKDIASANTIAVEGLDQHWSSVLRSIEFPDSEVHCISCDGRLAAVERHESGEDRRVELWDVMAGVMIASKPVPYPTYIVRYYFSRDSSCLAFHGWSYVEPQDFVQLWLLSNHVVLTMETPGASSIAISSDGIRLAWYSKRLRTLTVVKRDRKIADTTVIFDRRLSETDVPDDANLRLSFSSSDTWLLGHDSRANSILLWNSSTGDLVWRDDCADRDWFTTTSDEQYIVRLRKSGPGGDGNCFQVRFFPIADEDTFNPFNLLGKRGVDYTSLPQYGVKRLENSIIQIENAYYGMDYWNWCIFISRDRGSSSFVPRITSPTRVEVIDPSLCSSHLMPADDATPALLNSASRRKALHGCGKHTFAMMENAIDAKSKEVRVYVRDPQRWKPVVKLPPPWDTPSMQRVGFRGWSTVCSTEGDYIAHRISEKMTEVYRVHPPKRLFGMNHDPDVSYFFFSPKSTYSVVVNDSSASIIVWAVQRSEMIARIAYEPATTHWQKLRVHISPDDSQLVCIQYTEPLADPEQELHESKVWIYDLDNTIGKLDPVHFVVKSTTSPANALCFLDDNTIRITTSALFPLLKSDSVPVVKAAVWESTLHRGSQWLSSSRSLYQPDFKLKPHWVERSPQHDRLLIWGEDADANDYVVLSLEERHIEDPDVSSSRHATHRFNLVRQDPGETMYDTHSWSSYRLYSDGWLWDGSRRLTWIPHRYRPNGYLRFDRTKNIVRKFGDGVILYSEELGPPVILTFS